MIIHEKSMILRGTELPLEGRQTPYLPALWCPWLHIPFSPYRLWHVH